MIKKSDIEAILKNIPDPEMHVSIWDLGLVYGVDIDQKAGKVTITMTLTSLGCPLFDQIADPTKYQIGKLDGVKFVNVELTFEPPWNMDKMSEDGRAQLGF